MIETERLIIRELKMDDAPTMAGYRNKEEVYRYQSWHKYTYQQAVKRIDYCLKHPFRGKFGNYQLGITLKDTDILIGDIFIDVFKEDRFILGYTLDSTFWKKGYAIEATRALLQYMKEEYNFKMVLSYVYKENIPSIKLLKKLEFTQFEQSRRMGDLGYKKTL